MQHDEFLIYFRNDNERLKHTQSTKLILIKCQQMHEQVYSDFVVRKRLQA